MTAFVKPSSAVSSTGFFHFGNILPSYWCDYVDNNFQYALNKAGDTITGEIFVASGGVLDFQSGSLTIWENGSNVTVDSTSNWDFIGTLNIDGSGGGNINVTSAGAIYAELGSYLNLYGAVNFEATATPSVLGNFTFQGSSTTTFVNGSTVTFGGDLVFGSTGLLVANSGSSLTFNNGAQFTINNTTASYFNIANFPLFTSPQTKQLTTSFAEGLPGPCTGTSNGFDRWIPNVNSVGSVADADSAGRSNVNTWYVPLKVHNTGTLSLVFVLFQLNSAASLTPANPISFNVFRVNNSTGVVESLLSSAVVLPGSAYTTTSRQSVTLTCTTNNVIETYQFSYHLIVTDDYGTNSLTNNTFIQAITYHTNINSSQWGD